MKRITFVIILLVLLGSIVSSWREIYSLWQKQSLITKTRQDLVKEEETNKKLQSELKLASNKNFIEEEARDKLFLVKKDEQTVYISNDLLSQEKTEQKKTLQPQTNWQQWINLFFSAKSTP